MSPDAPVLCSRCGSALGHGAVGRICPRCEFAAALAPQPAPTPNPVTTEFRSFGDYELQEEVGHGAMGVVYRARQRSLGRQVALKLILFGAYASDRARRRFLLEAQSAAGLNHPNIVAIHDFGQVEGQPFFTMEFVAGKPLSEVIRDYQLPVPAGSVSSMGGGSTGSTRTRERERSVARLIETLSTAVHYAHGCGVIHRDLKPANVLIDGGGRLRLTDFGLARRVAEESSLTLTGQTLGTPAYMSPEQATANPESIDARTDVYGLGAILYHLLTGRPPLVKGSAAETLRAVQDEDPVRPRFVNPGVSLDLETICLKCLEKAPPRRYASAEALAEDLRRFIEDRPIQARPVGGVERVERWVRRRPALAASIAALHLVLALGLAGIVWQWRRAEGEASRATAATRDARNNLVRQYVAKGNEAAGAGRVLEALPWFLAALREEPNPARRDSHRLRLTTAASVAPRPEFVWAASNVVNVVALSPDERWVAAGTDEGFAQVWDLNSGEAVTPRLPHREAVRGLSFHPGGRFLLTFSSLRQAGAFGSAPGGRGSVRLWSLPEGPEIASFLHTNVVGQARFSPDGHWIASACADGRARLWRISEDDGTVRVLPAREWAHEAEVGSVDFSPDSSRLATGSLDGVVNLWELKGGTLLKRFENRPPYIGWNPEGRNVGTLFSPDGRRLVAYLEYRARAWEVESGGHLYDLEFSNSGLNGIRASAGGEILVSATRNGQVRTWSATEGLPQITVNASASALGSALRFGAAPTPDGSWLMLWGEEGLTFHEPTSGFVRPLHFPTRRVRDAATTREGRRVIQASAEGGVWVWNLVHAATAGRSLEMNDFGHRVRYSADGRRLVAGDHGSNVGFWDAETGRSLLPRLHAQLPAPWGIYDFATSPDGRRVLACDEGGGMRLYRFDTGMPLGPLWTNTLVGPSAAVFLPDGQHIVVADRGGVLRRLRIPEGISQRSITNAGAHAFRGLIATPDGREVITLSVDETARRWNSETLEPVGEPMDLGGPGEKGALTPDARLLITTCSSRGGPRVWDLGSCRLLHRLPQPVGQWESHLLAINTAGTQIATMSEGGSVRLWNPRSGKLDRILHYDGRVQALAFGPDDQRLGVGGDRGVRVWDLTTGEPLTPMLALHDRELGANQITFSPDGTHLAAAGGGARVRLWDLQSAPWTLADWEAFVGALCGARVEADGRLVSLSAAEATALRATVRQSFPREFSPKPEQNSEFLWMQAQDQPTPAAWRALLPHLDRAVASDLPDRPDLGFSRYRHMRAIARVQIGDMAGAAEDKPEVAIPGRDPACSTRQVDLSKLYNRGLSRWGWSTNPNSFLADLPTGKQVLGGIVFDIRGALKLDGNHPYRWLYPQRIEGIAVESVFTNLCVLQATDFDAADGTRVGEFVLHYADGDTLRLPMVYGEDLRNWWTVENETTNTPNAEVVWRGTNPSATAAGRSIRLFLRRYANPRPEVVLRSVDVVSTMAAAGPFVIAMTLE